MCAEYLSPERYHKSTRLFCHEPHGFSPFITWESRKYIRDKSRARKWEDKLMAYLFACSKPTNILSISICLHTAREALQRTIDKWLDHTLSLLRNHSREGAVGGCQASLQVGSERLPKGQKRLKRGRPGCRPRFGANAPAIDDRSYEGSQGISLTCLRLRAADCLEIEK